MKDGRPDLSDAGAAFAIGALVGVGVVMLLSAGPGAGTARVIRDLQESGIRCRPASRRQARELRRIAACVRRIEEVASS